MVLFGKSLVNGFGVGLKVVCVRKFVFLFIDWFCSVEVELEEDED